MERFGIPNTIEEVEERIKSSTSPVNGYVYIGDATDCRYLNLISCDFEIIGEEFSSKPYVIGVPARILFERTLGFSDFAALRTKRSE
ncbi:hypothetical protein WA026_015658 [Henosepilachna vigintioctopunctata]|uniref:Uncharacterized protein n=1 Tax=Henosepilachna vigintioctopunctata TaxID=420089 RepID=A0AAW1VDA5_9CUCU